MLRTQDPAEAGVTTALERARNLHDKVRAATNRAKANRPTTDGQELVALTLVRFVRTCIDEHACAPNKINQPFDVSLLQGQAGAPRGQVEGVPPAERI
jgi:hypothetical protein